MRLDGKVHGTLIKNKDGQEIPEDEFVVFRPADNAFFHTLMYYRHMCQVEGAKEAQLEAVDQLIGRVAAWRDAHPERCKTPDIEPNELRLR